MVSSIHPEQSNDYTHLCLIAGVMDSGAITMNSRTVSFNNYTIKVDSFNPTWWIILVWRTLGIYSMIVNVRCW
ncbi:hypothetical protein BDV28DRAFT_136889 [Aspergillus coremiiformis]|uniref:Uncharacterized protein n=1 Tax=Aspergillus coremiiformis TaxID=138285 RepID=A0A5N6Z1I1_9EURO|nr:hypothetical protein BDV28DRAFT_136889 [Aspergillus coremiiformis]